MLSMRPVLDSVLSFKHILLMHPAQSTAILPWPGPVRLFIMVCRSTLASGWWSPRAPIHSNNKLKVIPFVLPRFLLIMRSFVTHPAVCYTLCISSKTSFQCPRLWVCYMHVFFKVFHITLFLVSTQHKLFLLINENKFNLIYVINSKFVSW